MAQRVLSGIDLTEWLRVMQSDVNSHKTCKIIGYNIVYIIFFIVCNNIITIPMFVETNKLYIIR